VSILAEAAGRGGRQECRQDGNRKLAEAYLKFLYTPVAQFIIANNYFRPRNAAVAAKYKGQFPNMSLFTINKNFGGWAKAQKVHFGDGGTFDQVFGQRSAKRRTRCSFVMPGAVHSRNHSPLPGFGLSLASRSCGCR